jgi:hypothetical protein
MSNVRPLMLRLLVIAASAVLLQIVAQGAEPVDVSAPAVSCVGGVYGAHLPKKLSELRLMGQVREEQVVRVEQWDGYQAIERRIRFNRLSANVITFTNDPERYNVGGLVVESPRWSVSPIRVAQPSGPLLERLGVKSGVVRVVYECYTG